MRVNTWGRLGWGHGGCQLLGTQHRVLKAVEVSGLWGSSRGVDPRAVGGFVLRCPRTQERWVAGRCKQPRCSFGPVIDGRHKI